MSFGKYSPYCVGDGPFDRNAYGNIPPERKKGDLYDEKIHFANYDKEGYDSYGYSAFDAEGQYIAIGRGVDRAGVTEDEYMFQGPDYRWD